MPKQTREQVIAYMKTQIPDHTDLTTDEVNTTALAEDACFHFDAYENGCDIPEDFDDWAFEAVYGGGN